MRRGQGWGRVGDACAARYATVVDPSDSGIDFLILLPVVQRKTRSTSSHGFDFVPTGLTYHTELVCEYVFVLQPLD